MDQIYLGLMQTMQAATERQSTAGSDKSSEDGTSFRDLMEKNQNTTQATETRDGTAADNQPTDSPAAEQPDGAEEIVSQEQILSATLAVMQNPVVVVAEETVVTTPAAETAVQAVTEGAQQMGQAMQNTAETGSNEQNTSVDSAVKQETNVVAEQRPVTAETRQTTEADAALQQKQPEGAVQSDKQEQDMAVTQGAQERGAETAVFHDTEHVLVKVGESGDAEQAASVKEQTGTQISKALEQGKSQVTVQLNPENLGTIEVRMTMTDDGKLLVALHAENHQTQQLLEKDLGGLQQLLARSTQQEVEVQVPRQQEGQQQNFEDGRQQQHQQNPQQRRDEEQSSGDFMQQLRLGLFQLDAEDE